MTDNQATDTVVATEADDTGATVVGAAGSKSGFQAAGAMVTDNDYAIIVAAFPDDTAAMIAYEALQDAESRGQLGIEGVLVVKTDADSKVKVRKMTEDRTRTGVRWGAVNGLALGLIFPPTLLANTVGWGVVDGDRDKAGEETNRPAVGAALTVGLGPNAWGILALAKASHVAAAKQAMAQATDVRSVGIDLRPS